MGVSKLSANVFFFFKVNYFFKTNCIEMPWEPPKTLVLFDLSKKWKSIV